MQIAKMVPILTLGIDYIENLDTGFSRKSNKKNENWKVKDMYVIEHII